MIRDLVIAAVAAAGLWSVYYAGFRWNASDQAWLERVGGCQPARDASDDGEADDVR